MTIVSIILAILNLLPTLLPIIEEIWAKIHNHPAKIAAAVQALAKHAYVVGGSVTDEQKAAIEADVKAFHAIHVLGQPAA